MLTKKVTFMGLATRFVIILAAVSCVVTGCNKEIPAPPHVENKTSKPKKPIKGVSLDRLTPSWEGQYAVEQAGETTKFEREVGSHRIVIEVTHDGEGNVSRIAGKATGPVAAGDDRGAAYEAMLIDLLDALGLKKDQRANNYVQIGVLRTNANYAYNFTQDDVNFFLSPDRRGEGGDVERVMNALPVKGRSAGMPVIPGSSVQQLKELLEGFDIKLQIENEQLVFSRQQPTHEEIIHCYTNENGEIRRLEAFITNVKPDSPVAQLREALWVILADVEYEGCDPAKARDFITGEKLAYAAGDGRDVGGATYYSQVDVNGDRSSLEVFGRLTN
jgi:hypothetical protein